MNEDPGAPIVGADRSALQVDVGRSSSRAGRIRPLLVTGGEVERITLARERDGLPHVALATGANGPQKVWELPATATPGDPSGPCDEDLELLLWQGGRSERRRVSLRGLTRRSPAALGAEEERPEDDAGAWEQAVTNAEAVIGAHVDAMTRVAECPAPTDGGLWPRSRGRVLVRSLASVVEQWREADHGDEPRHALIVKLADELHDVLIGVCGRPRVVLSRVRAMQPVGRVQQVDPACLRWLARQPGRSVVERAGVRQEVQAIVRVEHADTHENRVLKDLLRRAARASEQYLREYRTYGNHERVRLVRRFLRAIRRLLKAPVMEQVRGLAGVAAPNYVLQHDRRYAVIWRAYQALVRQQTILDNAWRWRHRVWAEACQVGLLAAIEHAFPASERFRSDVILGGEHVRGRYLKPETGFAPRHTGTGWLQVVTGDELPRFEPSLDELASLAPDLVLCHRRSGPDARAQTVSVWSALHFGLEVDERGVVEQLSSELGRLRTRGLLLLPGDGEAAPSVTVRATDLVVLRVPIRVHRGVHGLAELLRDLLEAA